MKQFSTLLPPVSRRYAVTHDDDSPDRDSDADMLHYLIIEVRPAYRPFRWAWYATDSRSGEIVEYAFEYESPSEARRAGLARLEELMSDRTRNRGEENNGGNTFNGATDQRGS